MVSKMKGLKAMIFLIHAYVFLFFGIWLALGATAVAFSQTSPVPARIDAATYQRVVEENLDLRKEQARIEAEAGTFRRKNASLLLDIQDLERKRDQLTVLVSQLKTPDELAAQMARLNSEKVVLIREIERLRESLAATTSSSVVTNTVPIVVTPASGSDLFRKLEQENAELRQEVAKARATGMNESVSKEVSQKNEMALKAELSQLSAQLKEASAGLESTRRREAALKKALEAQAKKAFDAEKALKKAVEIQAQKIEEAEAAKQKTLEADAALKVLKEKLEALNASANNSAAQPSGKGPAISSLLASGQASLLAGRVKEAEEYYLQAFKRDPRNALISYNLGVIYGDYLKDFTKASKYYRNYLELDPNAADADMVRSWLVDMTAKAKW